MNSQFYLEKLRASEEYKRFMKENPNAYLCSGFFVVDKSEKNQDNKVHFDFYVPSTSSQPSHPNLRSQVREIDKKVINKEAKLSSDINSSTNNTNKASAIKRGETEQLGNMFSFQLENGVKLVPIEIFREIPGKIEDFNFEFEEVEKLIERKIQEEGINKKIQKILLSLQKIDDKDLFVGTVFISGLGLIKVNINVNEMKIVLFEKKSFFDMLKRLK